MSHDISGWENHCLHVISPEGVRPPVRCQRLMFISALASSNGKHRHWELDRLTPHQCREYRP